MTDSQVKTLREIERHLRDQPMGPLAIEELAAWRSQAEALVREWRKAIGDDTFENSSGCGNEDDMYNAGSNEAYKACADALAKLIGMEE